MQSAKECRNIWYKTGGKPLHIWSATLALFASALGAATVCLMEWLASFGPERFQNHKWDWLGLGSLYFVVAVMVAIMGLRKLGKLLKRRMEDRVFGIKTEECA